MSPFPSVRRVRDLMLWDDVADGTYVVACDANAGVGLRPADHLRRPPEEAGYNAAKVSLMEVMAAGAAPLLVVNTLCSPLDAYGRRVVDGIHRALEDAGRPDTPVTGSDETNMTTTWTGLGVTVIGYAHPGALTTGRARSGDVVVCLGLARDGLRRPYREGDPDIAGPADVVSAARSGLCHELLPVGSRGVAYEAGQLASHADLHLTITAEPTGEPRLDESAGASTCFLAACPPDRLADLRRTTTLPVAEIAVLGDRR